MYDDDKLNNLPKEYDLLIIDGPVGNNRGNFIHFIDKFKKDIPYVIDDTQREGDRKMALNLAERLNKKHLEIKGWQKQMIILL